MSNAPNVTESTTEQVVHLSKRAIIKVAQLLEEETEPLFLRIYITGGGCSGFQYGFMFDHRTLDGDHRFSFSQPDESLSISKVDLAVDKRSIHYICGASVDYQEGAGGQRFMVDNPNALTKCGCGSSFSVKDDASK